MKVGRIDRIIGAGLPSLALILLITTVIGAVPDAIGVHGMVVLFGMECLYFSSRSYRGKESMVIAMFYVIFGTLLILFGSYGLYEYLK